MEFKVFKNENDKILKEYWLTQSEWDALDKTTVQEGDIYHIVGTIDKGDLSADVNASLAKADNSLQKPTATLAKESFVKVGIDGTQKFDEGSYVVAPSTDGTAGQVLKKTETGSEWANESGKLYLHSLICSDFGHPEYTVYISVYSTRKEAFTVDYIKSDISRLKGAISSVIDTTGNISFDRIICYVSGEVPPSADFEISTYGAASPRILNFTSDEVTEL